MRGLLNRGDLDRYAGQFVWLELNFDEPRNHAFFDKYGVNATPTFLVLDQHDESVAEIQPGAMSPQELTQFFERGAHRVSAGRQSSADEALKQGDRIRGVRPRDAVAAYREALRIAPANWSDRELAEASLVGALRSGSQWQECAETAATVAAGMAPDSMLARTVVDGMWCLVSARSADWLPDASNRLEPLARHALSLPTTVRDHRDELYRTLMLTSLARHDERHAAEWGRRWLAELDAITPATDDERSAVDIARVENIQVYGDPARILPALIASERAMPQNYVASLRLAQAELIADHYDNAIAAIDRGLTRHPGALGRTWLLKLKAEVFTERKEPDETNRLLRLALDSAREIPNTESRKSNVDAVTKALHGQ